MMRALLAGGMEGNYRPEQDMDILKRRPSRTGYHPNPHGFFEGFKVPFEQGRGMVTKMTMRRFAKIQSDAPMMVLCMFRPIEERQASMDAWGLGEEAKEFTPWFAKIREGKPNARFWIVEYHTLLHRPHTEYDSLVVHGWPLTNKAGFVSAIDPRLYRNSVGK